MPRPVRIDIEGYWYHVTARGQRQERIFIKHADYKRYLHELNRAISIYGGLLGAYCLMPNHSHLIIYRRESPLSRIIHMSHSRYGKYFNNKYGTVGHVFQGRYNAKIVLNDNYLNALIKYIHGNPVRAGIVTTASKYSWSTDVIYRGKYGNANIKVDKIPGYEGKAGIKKYIRLMENMENPKVPVFKEYIGIEGEEQGIERRKEGREGGKYREKRGRSEVAIIIEYYAKKAGIDLKALRGVRCKRSVSKERSKLMVELYRQNYSPTDIARELNITPASVFRALERSS